MTYQEQNTDLILSSLTYQRKIQFNKLKSSFQTTATRKYIINHENANRNDTLYDTRAQIEKLNIF